MFVRTGGARALFSVIESGAGRCNEDGPSRLQSLPITSRFAARMALAWTHRDLRRQCASEDAYRWALIGALVACIA